jgi:hypothetical protein
MVHINNLYNEKYHPKNLFRPYATHYMNARDVQIGEISNNSRNLNVGNNDFFTLTPTTNLDG